MPEPAYRNYPRQILNGILTILLALWIFLEEWLWDHLQAFMAWLGKLPPIHWLETQLARLPPYAALVAFLIPALVLLPFKLAAFWLIAHGHRIYGVWVFIIAKIIGTAFLARIFSLTKNALLTIGWFAKAYGAITRWKQKIYDYVRALPAWQAASTWIASLKKQIKTWWRTQTGSK
ncbi:MAG: hypothetical protein JNM52_09700 [Betaproteobacteria bacterium]|nr:hypothetical protein [Betaproteobacteria bacterium]